MTKAEIVNEISKTTGIERAAVLETIEKFMEVVKDSLSHGEPVYLRGFGSFIIKTRKRLPAIYQRTPPSSSPNTKSRHSSPPRCLWKMSNKIEIYK